LLCHAKLGAQWPNVKTEGNLIDNFDRTSNLFKDLEQHPTLQKQRLKSKENVALMSKDIAATAKQFFDKSQSKRYGNFYFLS
jgi:hypothetical protein